MKPLSQFFRDYRQSGSLASLVNVQGFVDETDAIFLLKSGGVGRAYRLRGLDAECLDDDARADVVRRWHGACRCIGEGFTLQQFLIKERATLPAAIPHPNPVVDEATSKRLAHLASRPDDLYAFDLYVVLTYDPPPSVLAKARRLRGSMPAEARRISTHVNGARTLQVLDAELTAACRTLRERADTWSSQLRDLLQPTPLDCLDTLRLFQRLTVTTSSASSPS
jgi:type IV secretory pathway VirB4 component